jgi:addiction module RelE/StbE family toxin
MDYQIIWSPEALNQLGDLVRFISRDNPAAAEKLGNTIIEKVLLLAQFPEMGKKFGKLNRADVREVLVPPYRVIYQIHDQRKAISVLTIWHGARREPEIQ